MTHNKTLAAQLYSEFKQFFPNNHVEYFISYYDYYQPEAYIPRSDLFIEKDSSINEELERLRLSATASLLSFDDVIVIASVSANYGLGNPSEYKAMVQRVEVGFEYSQKQFLLKLVEMGYKRNDKFFDRADFRVNGDVIDIFPAYFEDEFIRVVMMAVQLLGAQIISTGFFQSIGYVKTAIFLSLLRQLILIIPALLVFPLFFGVNGIWMSIPISDSLATVISMTLLIYNYRQLKKLTN